MTKVNMLEAKTNLSKLVEAVETGKETEIILARNGKPVARIVPIEVPNRIIGIADGEFGELDEEWFKGFQAQDEELWKDWHKKDFSVPPWEKKVSAKPAKSATAKKAKKKRAS
jgi:prevent-host-death family protein